MKSNKNFPEILIENVIYDEVSLTITKESNRKLFFNIKYQPNIETYNVAEAVAILIKNPKYTNDKIWNITISNNDKELYSTAGAVLWLTGGLSTWEKLDLDWLDYYSQLDSEYGYQIMQIVKRSSTLNDIKVQFIEYFNLDKMYNSILKITS